jgi:glycosyltransferase involved in cell wall biosynthesis
VLGVDDGRGNCGNSPNSSFSKVSQQSLTSNHQGVVRDSMKITVIICTYNRCQSLPKALESVAASKFTETVDWEVLVVDNNSRDKTREVVEDFCRRYPGRFRYYFESRQGLCHARNGGVSEARGEILAFMDDDVTVEPTWLENLTASLHDSEWAGAGGKILPENDFSPPRWLSVHGPYSMCGVLALFDRGDKAGELDWAPFGANMAFRKPMFEKYGLFRIDLDRVGDGMLSGGDTEFGQRLVNAGERLRYEPSAVVYHPVFENRLNKKYFLAWYFGFGRSLTRERGRGPKVWGIPRSYLDVVKTSTSTMASLTLRWVLSLNPQRRFFFKSLVWRTAGEVTEFFQLARSKASVEQSNG